MVGRGALEAAVAHLAAALIPLVERYAPALQAILTIGGIFTVQEVAATDGLPAYLRREVHWDRIPKLLLPGEVLRDLYGWGTANVDSNLLLSRIDALLWSIGIP